jgi:hypothetical protein
VILIKSKEVEPAKEQMEQPTLIEKVDVRLLIPLPMEDVVPIRKEFKQQKLMSVEFGNLQQQHQYPVPLSDMI